MEAIVLAGGFGTRLQDVVKDMPKPMARVHDRPFLAYVMRHLVRNGVSRLILSVGYKREVIQQYFGDAFDSVPVVYAVETTPLGTGGGIQQSLKQACSSPVLVVNGDTFSDVDLDSLSRAHCQSKADVTLAAKRMDDPSRYGSIAFDATARLTSFQEKAHGVSTYINGGVYVMNKDLFDGFSLQLPYSLETDFLEAHLEDLCVQVVPCAGYFLGIGIPSDYDKAARELTEYDT